MTDKPLEPGYYWATDESGKRVIIQVPAIGCGYQWLLAYTDFNGPLVEHSEIAPLEESRRFAE